MKLLRAFRPFSSTKRSSERSLRRRLRLERMEDRRLMAGDIDLAGDVLTIEGANEYDDYARVELIGDELLVSLAHYDSNGMLVHEHTEDFDLQDVSLIRFFGYDGQDTFYNITPLPSIAVGGNDRDQFVGGSSVDIFYGDAGDDAFWGSEGEDFLYGGEGDLDYLFGQGGNDSLFGQGGSDWLEGGPGDDQLSGGSADDSYYFLHQNEYRPDLGHDTVIEYAGGGSDWLRFSDGGGNSLSTGVTVDMSNSAIQVVAQDYLSLTLLYPLEVDNVQGTQYGDVLVGNSLANKLEGREGNDLLMGRQGNDSYLFHGFAATGTDSILESAGGGSDRLDFLGFARHVIVGGHGVTVNLATGTTQVVAEGLSLKLLDPLQVENVLGSVFDDAIFGNNAANVLEGYLGNDVMYGRYGNDTLVGDAGHDTLYGEEDLDFLSGGSGDDYLDGGYDNVIDRLYGGLGKDTFVRHYHWFRFLLAEMDYIGDFSTGDTLLKRYHR